MVKAPARVDSPTRAGAFGLCLNSLRAFLLLLPSLKKFRLCQRKFSKEVKKKDIQAEVKCDAYFDGNPDPDQTGGGAGALTPLSPFPRLVS